MKFISQQDRSDLKRRFRKELKADVTIKFFTTTTSLLTLPGRDCPTCPQTQEILEDLTSLSNKLHLEIHDYFSGIQETIDYGVDRIPAIVVGSNAGSRLKYYGTPSGYEFSTIIEDLISISRKVSPLTLNARRSLRKLNREVHIQVFVTPSVQHCSIVARLAHAMALESKYIRADIIEIQEFPGMARLYNVSSVPKTVINEVIQIMGMVSEDQLLEKIMELGYVGIKPGEDV